jgi:threonine dehydratase
MPRFAPLTKVMNCRKFGASVVLHGSNLMESQTHARHLITEKGLQYINGYDDPAIIAGQGTIGLEIARQIPTLDAVVVPVGGGGLIAGIALAVKTIHPRVQVIGVEPDHAASFTAALHAGKPVEVSLKPTLADGLAVSRVGDNAFALGRPLIDRIVVVTEAQLALAVLRLMELEKAVVEGAGAAPLAACLAGLLPELKGKQVVLPLCGGNIDLTTVDRVLERGLALDGRLCRFTARISDRPGGLARIASLIAEEGASIIDIRHDRVFAAGDIHSVTVHCVVETRDSQHIAALRKRLEQEGFDPRLAEAHV